MKKIYTLLFALTLSAFAAVSCSEDEDPAPVVTTGDVSFWNDDSSVGNITVAVAGRTATVTANVNPSGCGQSGCANFNLDAGTYSFTASATTGETWSGSCNISAGGCLRFHLTN